MRGLVGSCCFRSLWGQTTWVGGRRPRRPLRKYQKSACLSIIPSPRSLILPSHEFLPRRGFACFTFSLRDLVLLPFNILSDSHFVYIKLPVPLCTSSTGGILAVTHRAPLILRETLPAYTTLNPPTSLPPQQTRRIQIHGCEVWTSLLET